MQSRPVSTYRGPVRFSNWGAGTGSLTRGLLRAGCRPERIIALEREPRLVTVLRKKFPAITVLEGDATRIGEHLANHAEQLCAVVSSLPIKWFSTSEQYAVVRPCLDRLGPGGSFIQLTNAFSSPLSEAQLGIVGREVGRVWLNLLPAQIWCYFEGSRAGNSLQGGMSRAVRMPRYRTIWISDVHLGTRGCKAEFLLDFLRHNDAAHDLPRRRHHRRLAPEEILVLAAGAQRRHPEGSAQGPQGDAGHLRPRQSRRVAARATRGCNSAASR